MITKLTPTEEQYVDNLAMARVEAKNSDEYVIKQIDDEIHQLKAHLKEYFQQRLDFHETK